MGLIASEKGLNIVERARIKKSLGHQAFAWYDKAYVSLPTLKRFLGGKKAICENNFKAICEVVGVNWNEIVDREKSRKNRVEDNSEICLEEDCDKIPDVQIFYGRKKEFEDLKQSILEKLSRAIILCGQSGIGKTALAAKLAEQVKSDFDCFSWRSLNYSPPPTLSELLFGLIKVLSSEEKTGLPSVVDDFNVDGLIKKLLKIFGERPILLVVDGWEKYFYSKLKRLSRILSKIR